MALDKNAFVSDLTDFFSDIDPNKTASDKASELWGLIQAYIESGELAGILPDPSNPGSMLPAGGFPISWPAMAAGEATFMSLFPGTASTDPTFVPPADPTLAFIGAAVLAASTGGTPNPATITATNIVPGGLSGTGIGVAPVVPFIFIPRLPATEPTAEDAANDIATAIHNMLASILFTVTIVMPPPAPPVPMVTTLV